MTDDFSKSKSARGFGQYRSWVCPTSLVVAAALGALVALVTIWSLGPTSSTVERTGSLKAAFGSSTMTIVDQDGTVDVDVWVRNESRVTKSVTCAVIVTSGTGQRHHMYRGSAAFTLASIEPHESRHLVEVVTGVYYDGDATGPIGSRFRPLPQHARLGRGSFVECA